MGAAPSKIDDDKSLALCQERKRFVRQALDGRCNLAAAHFSYVESLRNTGIALRRFADPGCQAESSLFTMSTSAIPDVVPKTISQFSNSSPVSNRHVEMTDSFSPSPISSSRFHVNHMKAVRMASKIVQEKPPVTVTATLESSYPRKPVQTTSGPEESTNYEAPSPPPPGTPPWDYFGLFQPVDDRYTLDDGHGIDHTEDIRRLREEEGIPDLEEEHEEENEEEQEGQEQEVDQQKEKLPSGDVSGDDFGDTDDDDFDKSSKEDLVRMFENRNLLENHDVIEDLGSDTEQHNVGPVTYETDESRTTTPVHVFNIHDVEDFGSDMEPRQNGEKENNMSHAGTEESRTRTPVRTPPRVVNPRVTNPLVANGKLKEHVRSRPRDFSSCMKEIEELFRKAAESGKEVPRMLEADKVHFRPLTADEIAQRSGASTFLMSFFTCCVEEPLQPQASVPSEVKYLTWHKSVSSLSSSSKIPIEETTRDNIDSVNSYIAGGVYMNSGSHASTLDRLYAWERKLYDEVKASGTIRTNYDFKCKLLRQQESRGESQQRIDKTRAAVKDLHSRIRVAIQRIDKISKEIEEIRDKELEPQLEELIEGLIRMWAMMLECHRHQLDIIQNASANGSIRFPNQPELQSQAALTLSHELHLLSTNFTKWILAHKSYLERIDAWIGKCVSPLQQKTKRKKRQQDSLRSFGAPPIFATCEDWLKIFTQLPTSQVVEAIKDLTNMTTHFLPHQEKRGKSLKSSLSLAKNGISGEILRGENTRRNDSPVDWSLNCDNFQSRLVVFLGKLSDFAHSSLDSYQNLKMSIDIAKQDYEKDHSQYRR
ncbi:DUF630 family protein (DUF630 and DUF632) [Rhynchospora pubera]|uniref:DUF630 family protein (DUF630 and DUF632) n=1 Tax=Rhynchospora pubera TaxID=906938 RepID=A0AAV8D6P0_9POAL|nr:DUF630 family protein (DUF630 and DUF632) [Rhynchospora pubera]